MVAPLNERGSSAGRPTEAFLLPTLADPAGEGIVAEGAAGREAQRPGHPTGAETAHAFLGVGHQTLAMRQQTGRPAGQPLPPG